MFRYLQTTPVVKRDPITEPLQLFCPQNQKLDVPVTFHEEHNSDRRQGEPSGVDLLTTTHEEKTLTLIKVGTEGESFGGG